MISASLARKLTGFSAALLLAASSVFIGAPAVVAQDALEGGPRDSTKTTPGDSQEGAELLSAVTRKLEAQITNIQTAVGNGSLSVEDANVILAKVRNLLTKAISLQTSAPDAGGLEDIAKQTGTLIVAVSRMIDIASDGGRNDAGREPAGTASNSTAAAAPQRPAVGLSRTNASVTRSAREAARESRKPPKPKLQKDKTPDPSVTASIIQQSLLLMAQARTELSETDDLVGYVVGAAETLDQKLSVTTQDILDTQTTTQGVIVDANDGLISLNDASGALGDATSSVSGITQKTGSGDAETLILGLLETMSGNISALEAETQQALTQSQAALDQTG